MLLKVHPVFWCILAPDCRENQKTNTGCMLNNPLSQLLSLINYSKNTSLGNILRTTDTEIGLIPNNHLQTAVPHPSTYYLQNRAQCKPEPTQSERLNVDSLAALDCISLAALCWEELTAANIFCQKGLYSQTKQPCNRLSHFNQVTDKQSVSPDYCGNIVPHTLQLMPPSQSPTSLQHTEHSGVVQVLPRPCTGYKQTTHAGKQSSCLFNKWLLPWLQ